MTVKTRVKLCIRWAVVRPETALRHLRAVNTHNRNMSPDRVALYATDMRDGHWLQSTQPILFDEHGVLLDGQHRLAAVVDSDTTQTFLFIEGVSKEVQLVIDSGRPRNDADKLRLGRGLDVTARKVAVAKAMMNPNRFGIVNRRGRARKPTTTELAGFTKRHDRAISFACSLFTRRHPGVAQASVVGVVARAWYGGADVLPRLQQFVDVLYSGINRGEKDVAAILLRDTLSRVAPNSRSSKSSAESYGQIEAALEAFLDRKNPGTLTPATEERFPLPEEVVRLNWALEQANG